MCKTHSCSQLARSRFTISIGRRRRRCRCRVSSHAHCGLSPSRVRVCLCVFACVCIAAVCSRSSSSSRCCCWCAASFETQHTTHTQRTWDNLRACVTSQFSSFGIAAAVKKKGYFAPTTKCSARNPRVRALTKNKYNKINQPLPLNTHGSKHFYI